ncbi:tetratricopeptide repeat protein [Streptomyces sp. NPDC057690]|uniref:tetratricopeptide repeat protein n=1 Tax=Streptomyces sp. NPDC057690 TaxID=3346214 RepID=UPI0036D00BBC
MSDSSEPRQWFRERFAELLEAAGTPRLDQVAARANHALRQQARRGGNPPRSVNGRRTLSAWKTGDNVPDSSGVLNAVVNALIQEVRARSVVSSSLTPGLLDAARWESWRAAALGQRRKRSPVVETAAPLIDLSETSLAPPYSLLPRQVRGREDILEELTGVIHTHGTSTARVLTSLGGSGKSTIALELARRCERSGAVVWWVSAGDALGLSTGMLGVAGRLGARADELDDARAGRTSVADLVWRYLRDAPDTWLLILDNADDPSLLSAAGSVSGNGGERWIRQSPPRGTLLVTSRTRDPRQWGAQATLHEVGPLPEHEAAGVLLDLAPAAGERRDAARLAARLTCLPLALTLAGSYLASPLARVRTFAEYGELIDRRLAVLDKSSGMPRSPRQMITMTWEISLDALAKAGIPDARRLLRVMAQFDASAPVPVDLLDPEGLHTCRVLSTQHASTPGAIEDARDHALAALHAVGLVAFDACPPWAGGEPAIRMHALVAQASREHQPSDDEQPRTPDPLLTALALLRRDSSRDDPEAPATWPRWRHALTPHTTAVLNRLPAGLPDAMVEAIAHTAAAASKFLRKSGLFEEARQLLVRAMTVAEGVAEHHDAVLLLRLMHALVLDSQGRHSVAEAEFRDLIEASSAATGAQGLRTLSAKHGLGTVLLQVGRLDEAEEILREVIEVRRQQLGDTHPETLLARSNLTHVFIQQGRRDEAQTHLRDIVAAQTAVLGADHPDTMTGRHNLTAALHDDAEAVEELRALVATRTRLLGEEHPHTLRSRANLAIVRHRMGDGARSEADLKAVLHTQQRVMGHAHLETANTWHALLDLFRDREDFDSALEELRRMDAAGVHRLLPSMPDARMIRRALALSLTDAGAPAEAEVVLRQLLSVPGDESRAMRQDLFLTQDLLAGALYKQGKAEAAVGAWEDLLARTDTSEQGARNVLIARNNLATVLDGLGRPRDAIPHFRHALTGLTELDDEPAVQQLWHNLVRALWAAEDLEEAESEAKAALNRLSDGPSPHHGTLLLELAGIVRDKGDLPAAERLFGDAETMCREVLGADHSDTRTAAAALAHVRALRMALPDTRGEPAHESPSPVEGPPGPGPLRVGRLRVADPLHPQTATVCAVLAQWRVQAGDAAGACDAYAFVVWSLSQRHGPHATSTTAARLELAKCCRRAGDYASAVASYELALEGIDRRLGSGHPATFALRRALAQCRSHAGDAPGAVSNLEELLADQECALGTTHLDLLETRHDLAVFQGMSGDVAAAASGLAELVPLGVNRLGDEAPFSLLIRVHAALWRSEAGDPQGALTDLEPLIPLLVRVLGPEHPQTRSARTTLKNVQEASERPPWRIHP